MKVLVWVEEGTWPACVDAARDLSDDITLLHVVDEATVAAMSGPVGLLGRSGGGGDPEFLLAEAERTLIDEAVARLGREVPREVRRGRPEREVVAACADVDLLVLARNGDRSRLGPRSLAHHTRFVVDHAPCQVLLVWPEATPGLGTIPPPPHHDRTR
ncbi:universal stress protein [Actinoplanes friuliensis]|uniref:UspA domain-containing protein n=1 Tax=Actinoplanes friuliensis DSM 7358 TaxID=1246995 RepID=U5WF25_9ACTN|nr:universal stress protein [Actinoplanes friuliensis]AGZ46625.1 UspA domain-containing protein [Actinoplanes friuliensis DSM 7358]